MGGFGALDLGRHKGRFCAVGGHSPAVFERGNDDISFGFDNAADFARNDLIGIARKRSPYDAPVWIDIGDKDPLRPADACSPASYEPAARMSASTCGLATTTATIGTRTSLSTCASTPTRVASRSSKWSPSAIIRTCSARR